MKHLNLNLIGRFGNTLFQYAWARAYAERHGMELHTTPWIGQKIFELNDPPFERELPHVTEEEVLASKVVPGNEEGFWIEGYFQRQRALDYYSRSKAKEWLRFRPEVKRELELFYDNIGWVKPDEVLVFHERRGDYLRLGYPIVSGKSTANAYGKYINCWGRCKDAVTEESPHTWPPLTGELSFLPDFYMMIRAACLFRANSSFSYWAAVLADDSQRVFSPRIDGKPGGVEVDCEFEEGNHCRLANFDFCTDLHLAL